MKAIIAADIHGNYKYTKKLEELINKYNPDKIILLGDILYHSTTDEDFNALKTINILNKYVDKIIAVRGNCDKDINENLVNFDIRSDYKEIVMDGIRYILTHGHLLPYLMDQIKDNYTLTGHTHVYIADGMNLNPGSVGIPKINKEHTCFYYEDKTFYLIDLDTLSIIMSRKI